MAGRFQCCCALVGTLAGCGRIGFHAAPTDGSNSDDGCAACLTTQCQRVGGTGVTNGLVLHWKLDETSGNMALDSSPSGIVGTPSSHVWRADGMIDGAIEIPINASGVDGIGPALDAVVDRMTFAAWFKDLGSDTTAFHNVISKVDFTASPLQGWAIQNVANTTNLQLRIDTTGGQNQARLAFAGTLDGQWHHLAFTLDAGVYVAYVDGVESRRGTYTHGTGLGNPGELVLGTDNAIAAMYDDVRYYARALDPAEILSLVDLNAPRLREWIRSSTGAAAVTSLDIARPPTLEPGDLVLIVFTVDDSGLAPAPPDDFTLLTEAEGASRHIAVYFKLAGASEPASYHVSWNGPDQAIAYALRITRADPSNPFGEHRSTLADSEPATFPVFTTTVTDTLVVAALSTPVNVSACGGGEWNPPFSKLDCFQHNSDNNAAIGYFALATAGSLANPTFNFFAPPDSHASALVEVRPAPCDQ